MVGIVYKPTVSLASLGTIAAGAVVYHLTRERSDAVAEIVQR
jgi:hypothetical protein